MPKDQDAHDIPAPADQGNVDFLASLKLITVSLRQQRGKIIVACVLATVSVLLEVFPIWVVYKLIVLVVSDQGTPELFLRYAAMMAVSIPLGVLCFGLATRLSHVTAFNLLHALRIRMAQHMARLPIGYFAKIRSGQAKQTMITEPEKLELLVAHAIPEGASALMSWIVVTVWLLAVEWRMALASIILTPVSLLLMAMAIRKSYAQSGAAQTATEDMNGALVEFLSGMPVIKIFGQHHLDRQDAAQSVTRLADLQSAMGRAFVPLGGTFYALILANITVILTVGVWLLNAGQIEFATLLFFVILGANYSTPLMRLFDLFHHFAHISLSATSARKILDETPQEDSAKRVHFDNHDVCFQDVRFAYDAEDVLHDIRFRADTGTVTALVGPSGSGKTTIATLIPRFHDISHGSITLGGHDIREIGLDALMDAVAFVFQDPFLFSASIAENIRFGRPDASDDDVKAAAKAAQAHDFIMALPQGYDTVIGLGAQILSGGEGQRISLARAIIKDAPVIVLDEATAFTDPDSEAEIQQAISALAQGKTLIVVAHRLHTIVGADQILVINDGRIAERGTHDDLRQQGGLYAQMWRDYTVSQSTTIRQGEV